jgi:hypothetical protein
VAQPTEAKVAYVCKRLWDSEDWASLELYPSLDAVPSDHRGCGIVAVRVTLDRIVPDRGKATARQLEPARR